MDLSNELETMVEIEKMIENSKLKSKLINNEVINAEEFLNESQADEVEQNEMKSMYLTEPLNINTKISSK